MNINLNVLSKNGTEVNIPIPLYDGITSHSEYHGEDDIKYNYRLYVPIDMMREHINRYLEDKISNKMSIRISYDEFRADCFRSSLIFEIHSPTNDDTFGCTKCKLIELCFYIKCDLANRQNPPKIIIHTYYRNDTYINRSFDLNRIIESSTEGFSKLNVDSFWKKMCDKICGTLVSDSFDVKEEKVDYYTDMSKFGKVINAKIFHDIDECNFNIVTDILDDSLRKFVKSHYYYFKDDVPIVKYDNHFQFGDVRCDNNTIRFDFVWYMKYYNVDDPTHRKYLIQISIKDFWMLRSKLFGVDTILFGNKTIGLINLEKDNASIVYDKIRNVFEDIVSKLKIDDIICVVKR